MRGLCACGCGRQTPIAKYNDLRKGAIKGMPRLYCRGHRKRKLFYTLNGYTSVYAPGHYRSSKYGYVLEHILLAERALGKPLPLKAEVHHLDGKRGNNNCNLVICENRAYHQFLNRCTRAYVTTGDPDKWKCRYCHQWDDFWNLYISPYESHAEHQECSRQYRHKRKLL